MCVFVFVCLLSFILGFVQSIARTCRNITVSSAPVEQNTCLEKQEYRDYYATKHAYTFILDGSICRCSGDLCNNREATKLDTCKFSKQENLSECDTVYRYCTAVHIDILYKSYGKFLLYESLIHVLHYR